MKRVFIIFFLCLFLFGCDNSEEQLRNKYLNMKNNLLDEIEYTDRNDLPLEIETVIDRVDEENIKYKIVLKNPKENMNKIKAMVVHNYYTEDLFPSIGIFDEERELLVGMDKTLELDDSIETTKNISQIDLEFRVWIEYYNDFGQKKEIYYKTT